MKLIPSREVLDASTLETIRRDDMDGHVGGYEIAELYIRAKRPVAFDAHSEIITTGRFVISDGFDVVGGGIVVDDTYPRMSSGARFTRATIFSGLKAKLLTTHGRIAMGIWAAWYG